MICCWAEFPQLTEILKKNGAEGEEGLGQAQFANLLQPVLQEVADALAANPIVVVQNIKANNGTKLRKVSYFPLFFFHYQWPYCHNISWILIS